MFYRNADEVMTRALNEAIAYRKDGKVHVFMSGELPTPCHEVRVVDKYPGGNIMYIKDPDTAQLFIEIEYKLEDEGMYCIQITVPFFIGLEMPDGGYDEVTIYVNNEVYGKIKIKD